MASVTSVAATPARGGNKYVIALVAALGLIPIVLDTTIVNVALPQIRQALHADVNTAQWVISGYYLASAAVVAVGGYLASRFGRKWLFILGLLGFTLGSALCAVAPTMSWLIAFRVFQGIGGGILLPIGPALAFDGFPQEERAKASALIGVPLLLAPIFGPILGGYLNDTFDWNSIFYINLPVGALAVALALVVFPREQGDATRRAWFDWLGLALSTIGIVAIVYGLTLVTRTDPATVSATNPAGDLYGWGYWMVWALIGAGAIVLAIFAVYSLRISRDPALDLRQLARRDFLVSSVFTWATALITLGLLVLLPLYFESVRTPGLSALDTGLALVPFGAGGIVGTLLAAALYRVLGPRLVVMIGAAISALSAWLVAQTIQPTATASQLLAAAQAHTAVASLASADDLRWSLFLVGMGFTVMNIPMQTLALEALNGEALAKASSLFLSTKLIFSSIGVAILTTLLVSFSHSRASDLVGQLQTLAGGVGAQPSSPQALAALHALLAQIGVQSGAWAIQQIFWLIFYGTLALVALALALPGRRRATAAPAVASAEETAPLQASAL